MFLRDFKFHRFSVTAFFFHGLLQSKVVRISRHIFMTFSLFREISPYFHITFTAHCHSSGRSVGLVLAYLYGSCSFTGSGNASNRKCGSIADRPPSQPLMSWYDLNTIENGINCKTFNHLFTRNRSAYPITWSKHVVIFFYSFRKLTENIFFLQDVANYHHQCTVLCYSEMYQVGLTYLSLAMMIMNYLDPKFLSVDVEISQEKSEHVFQVKYT